MSVAGKSGYHFEYIVAAACGTLTVDSSDGNSITFMIKRPATPGAGMADGSREECVSLSISKDDYTRLVACVDGALKKAAGVPL